MQCPKCGASQEDGRTDCSVCGIIFSRWRPSQERQIPRNAPQFASDAGDGGNRPFPLWALAVGIAFLLVFGVIWTAKRHAARASGDETAELHRQMNEINMRGLRERAVLERENAKIGQAQYRAASAAAAQTTFPSDLSELMMRQMIAADCAAMKNPVVVKIPRSFQKAYYDNILTSYPALFPALRDGYVVTDPPLDSIYRGGNNRDASTIQVKIPVSAYSRMLVSEADQSVYEIDLGKRVVDTLRKEQSISANAGSVAFSWRYEQMAGESLGPDDNKAGGADFEREGSFWKLRRVWLMQEGRATTVCGI